MKQTNLKDHQRIVFPKFDYLAVNLGFIHISVIEMLLTVTSAKCFSVSLIWNHRPKSVHVFNELDEEEHSDDEGNDNKSSTNWQQHSAALASGVFWPSWKILKRPQLHKPLLVPSAPSSATGLNVMTAWFPLVGNLNSALGIMQSVLAAASVGFIFSRIRILLVQQSPQTISLNFSEFIIVLQRESRNIGIKE